MTTLEVRAKSHATKKFTSSVLPSSLSSTLGKWETAKLQIKSRSEQRHMESSRKTKVAPVPVATCLQVDADESESLPVASYVSLGADQKNTEVCSAELVSDAAAETISQPSNSTIDNLLLSPNLKKKTVRFSDDVVIHEASMEPAAIESRKLSEEVIRRLSYPSCMYDDNEDQFAEDEDGTMRTSQSTNKGDISKYPTNVLWGSFIHACANMNMCA